MNRPDQAGALLDAGASVDAQLKNSSDHESDRLTRAFDRLGPPSGRTHFQNGESALQIAATFEGREVVPVLVGRGASMSKPADLGTPLNYAVWFDEVEVAELLADNLGAEEFEEVKDDLLFRAAEKGATAVAALLIERGADINATDMTT